MSTSHSPANLSPTNSASSSSHSGTSPPKPETLSPKAAQQPSSPKASSGARPALLSGQSARRSFLGRVARSGLHGLRKNKAVIKLDESVDPNAPAVGWLVVQVLAGRDLVAKDKNGLSDPFVNIRYGNTRVSSKLRSDMNSERRGRLTKPWVVGYLADSCQVSEPFVGRLRRGRGQTGGQGVRQPEPGQAASRDTHLGQGQGGQGIPRRG
jgi:hypothetical protein